MTHPAAPITQRILIVDDDHEIVRLLRAYLEQAGYQVLAAYDGETAIHIIRSESPGLVLLDLMLPDRNGWDITRIVRNSGSNPALQQLPIIMLTARIEDFDKIVGLELGADDYITKPFNPREVVARVAAVLRRTLKSDSVVGQTVFQLAGLTIDLNRHTTTLDELSISLTPTEFKILHLFMSNPGHAFTRAEIAEKVVGYDDDMIERSLDSHIKNLRKKIEPDTTDARNEARFIHTVYGVGYRFAEK